MRLIDVLHDERGFVHKSLLGLGKRLVKTIVPRITSFIPGGSIAQGLISSVGGRILGGIGGRFFGGRLPPSVVTGRPSLGPPRPVLISTPRPTPPRTQTARVTPMSQAQKQFGLHSKFPEISDVISTIGGALGFGNGNGNGLGVCLPPNTRVGEICVAPGTPAGPAGEASIGRFGPAQEPTFVARNVRLCPAGMVLGKGENGLSLCYNKGAISNKERLYPRGTRPLLTGGEMRAINKASRAEGKVRSTALRLGILAAAPRKKRTPAGHKAKLVHA